MSRRWAIFERFDIRDEHGDLYLRRWRLLQTPWFAVYVHKIARPDKDRHLHDHPWTFASLILRGGYDELLRAGDGTVRKVRRGWLSWGLRRAEQMHRIARLHRPVTWTLVLTGRRRRDWGFRTDSGWVQWERYLGLDGAPAASLSAGAGASDQVAKPDMARGGAS